MKFPDMIQKTYKFCLYLYQYEKDRSSYDCDSDYRNLTANMVDTELFKMNDLISKILNWFILIMSAIVIYMLILKITGHSPTMDQIQITMLSLLGAGMFKLFYNQGRIIARLDSLSRQFYALAKDFKECKNQHKI